MNIKEKTQKEIERLNNVKAHETFRIVCWSK